MAQWQFKDICYPNEAAALQAFKGQWEFSIDGSASATLPYSWYLTSATVTPAGLITYAIKRSAGTATQTGQTYQLSVCDDKSLNSVFDKMPMQDMLFAAALVVIFVLGIGQGWRS